MAEFSAGYDYEYVDCPPKSLECSICLLTLQDPHVTTCCGNHFCHFCISRIRDNNKPCPLCNELGFTSILHKGVLREVNALKMYCPNKPQGCDWMGELGYLKEHLNPESKLSGKGCCFTLVECRYNCGHQDQQQMIAKHETEECLKRPVDVQIAFLAKKITSLATEMRAVKQENKSLFEKSRAIEADVSSLKAENNLLKKQLEVHSPPASVPPFYFTIYNLSHYKKFNIVLISPPFYSHPGGYKMELEVAPNGINTESKPHLSVFIRTLRGEYDDKLQWPFEGVVIIEMYNFVQEKWTRVYSIDFAKSQYGMRSIDERGYYSYGNYKVMSHYQLLQEYSRNDYCRFRVN